MLTVESEVNGDSKRTNLRVIPLWTRRAGTMLEMKPGRVVVTARQATYVGWRAGILYITTRRHSRLHPPT
jgi:hypothetical protein